MSKACLRCEHSNQANGGDVISTYGQRRTHVAMSNVNVYYMDRRKVSCHVMSHVFSIFQFRRNRSSASLSIPRWRKYDITRVYFKGGSWGLESEYRLVILSRRVATLRQANFLGSSFGVTSFGLQFFW